MSDHHPPPQASNAYRDEFQAEIARNAAFYERFESRRRETELQVAPLIEWRLASDRGAVDVGIGLLKNAVLLNGGGLVAIPAIVALFRLDPSSILRGLVATGAAFSFGILLSWAASIVAFFTLARRADALLEDEKGSRHQIIASYDGGDQRHRIHAVSQGHFNTSARHWKLFRRLRYAVIGLCLLAFLAFIAGAIEGGRIIMWATPHP